MAKTAALIIAFALFLPNILFAETADIGEILVTAQTDGEVEEAPTSFATVIKPEEENATFESVSELISASPGVTSRSLGGLGQFSTVSIRGSSAEQVSVYLDGVRLNTATSGAFDFSTIPIDMIDRVEIIRGGGTAQFGGDAIGGVINIITKKAGEKRAIEALAGGGSFTTIKAGSSYRQQFKKNSLALSWSHLNSKGNYTFITNPVRLSGAPSGIGGGRTYTRIHNSFISEGLLADWTHSINEKINLRVLNDFFFTNRDVPGTEDETTIFYPTNPLDAKEKIFRNTSSCVVEANKFFIDEARFSGGITNNLNADVFKDKTPALGNPIDTTTYTNSLNPFLKWDFFFDNKTVGQIITFRYDYRYDYLNDSSPLENANLTGKKTRQTHGVFVQDELAFLDEKIIFLPSFRYENASDFPDNLGFRGGLKISPLNWLALKTNIERSFRYPTFDELYFPDQGYIRGNPDLKKEEAWNFDAGFGVNTKYGSFEFAYFKNWVNNSILFVPISATTIMPVNTFKLNTQGFEVGATAKPLKYLSARASYTFLDAHYASNNKQLPGRPRHDVYARLDIGHDWGKKFGGTIFGRFDYKSALPVNTSNTVFLGARSTIDLGLNLRFAKNYYAIFEAKNVTNVQIYDARGFPLPRRSFFATIGGKWS